MARTLPIVFRAGLSARYRLDMLIVRDAAPNSVPYSSHAVPFLIMFSGIFPTEATARSMSCPLLISRLSASTDFRP